MDKIDDTFNQSGLRTQILTSELDGKMYAHYQQDLEPHVEYATTLRNDDEYTRNGIKKGWLHVCHIPDVAIIELRGIGVDIFRATVKEIVSGLKKLNKEHLLTTRAQV
jgi:hypothetical protein